MTVGATPVNTGLIMQKQAVIEKANQMLLGKSAKDLQAIATGILRELSEEEVRELHAKAKNEPRTLQTDRSEIINNIYSKTGDNITYEIDGVLFSNEEMKQSKELVKQAISELPTMGSDLDYEDYAAMGLVTAVCQAIIHRIKAIQVLLIVPDSQKQKITEWLSISNR